MNKQELDRKMQVVLDKIGALEKGINPKKFVTVGIQEGTGMHGDSGITVAGIAAVNEFGATISHPGGTTYGYKNLKAAENGHVRFIKKDTGYMEMGVTKPHIITIPERSFMRSTMREKRDEYISIVKAGLKEVIKKKATFKDVLTVLGETAQEDIQAKMVSLMEPPNAPSTIRKKKGTNNPLIDTGLTRQSIRYKIETEE